MNKTTITYTLGIIIAVLLLVLSYYDYLFLIPLAIGSAIFIILKVNIALKKDFFRLISRLVVLTAKYSGSDNLNKTTQNKLKDFLSENGLDGQEADELINSITSKSYSNLSLDIIKQHCAKLNDFQHLFTKGNNTKKFIDILFSAVYQTKKYNNVLKTIKEELFADSHIIDIIYDNVKREYAEMYCTNETKYQDKTNQGNRGEGQKKRQEFVTLTIKLLVETLKVDRSKMVCELDVIKAFIYKYDKDHFQERVEEVKKQIYSKYDENIDSLCKKILYHYRLELKKREDLLKVLIEIVYADGVCNKAEEKFLKKVARDLEIFQSTLDELIGKYEKRKNNGQRHNNNQKQDDEKNRQSQNQSKSQTIYTSEIEKAYAALGITEEATDRELNACWRNLMRVNHPDLMESRGPEAVRKATEKCQEINKAFEIVKASRGMK